MTGLLSDLAEFAAGRLGGEPALVVRARHRQALEEVQSCLTEALKLDEWDAAVEIVAEQMRRGMDALGRLIGRVTPDDILGEIFSAFCIGK